jgi:mannosyltransferase OCH1-like enzyme
MTIPKIIHQLAPADRAKWSPVWTICSESWKNSFSSDFQHIVWNDEDAEDIVRRYYPQFLTAYKEFPFHIIRIDFVRWCMLHKFGGIYADMDMFCYKNFHSELTDDCYLIESDMEGEIVQNSLMASIPKHPFWYECMEKSVELFYNNNIEFDINNIRSKESNFYVLEIAGPRFLSKITNKTNKKISLLPRDSYNLHYLYYDENIRTKHMLTGIWGKEMIDLINKNFLIDNNNGNLLRREYLKTNYELFKKVDIDKFDFKRNYLAN